MQRCAVMNNKLKLNYFIKNTIQQALVNDKHARKMFCQINFNVC